MKNKTYLINTLPEFCISYKYWNETKNNNFKTLTNKQLIKALYIEYDKDYYYKIASENLILTFRQLISSSIKRRNWKKNSKTQQILGCSFQEFKIHIEKQFIKGMSWDNQGKWHFDHIYPISLAKNEEELIRLNHYTNFQPLWAIDNLKKGNKIIEKQLTLI